MSWKLIDQLEVSTMEEQTGIQRWLSGTLLSGTLQMTQGGLEKFILLLLFLLFKLEEEVKKSKYRETNRAKGKRKEGKNQCLKC